MSTRLIGDNSRGKTSSPDDNFLDSKRAAHHDLPPSADLQEAVASNGLSGLWRSWRRPVRDLDTIATQRSVFDDPATLEVYRPPPEFENAHRFDPDARWTLREERVRITRLLYLKFAINLELPENRA